MNCTSSSSALAKLSAELDTAESIIRQKKESPPVFKLSSDLLGLIIFSAIRDDPGAAVRMSHVCKRWRSAIIAFPPAWRSLKIGRLKSFARVKAWLHRSNGRLEELIVSQNPPSHMVNDLARLLSPAMPHLRRLELHGVESSLLEAWRGLCRSLRFLSLDSVVNLARLDANLLSSDAPGPFAISVTRSTCVPSRNTTSIFLLPPGSMRRVQSIKLRDISDAPPEVLPHALCPLTTTLLSLEFDNCAILSNQVADHQEDDGEAHANITMTRLQDLAFSRVTVGTTRYSRREHVFPFDRVEVPSLTRLRLSRLRNGISSGSSGDANPLGQMSLTDSLPRLEVLDLSACIDLTLSALKTVLPQLGALRFLNVSHTQVGVDLVELLANPTSEGRMLLPRLVALSAAACDLTGGPVVRFVKSRLDLDHTRTGLGDRPVRKRQRLGPFHPTGIPDSDCLLQTESKSRTVSPHSEEVAKIKWLCLDGNASIEIEAVDWLRKAVQTVSCQWDSVNSTRAAGAGRWTWDAS